VIGGHERRVGLTVDGFVSIITHVAVFTVTGIMKLTIDTIIYSKANIPGYSE
jgi:hypothetical protein